MTELRELEERKYVDGDMEKIHVRPEYQCCGLKDAFKNMNAYSYYDDNQIIGILGVLKVNSNTCELCILLDECSKQYVGEIYHYAFKTLAVIQQYFVRIQAVVRTDWLVAIRFIERLGFKREGLMKKFGPDGNDFYLYGRIK